MNGLTTDPFRIAQELITEQTKNGKKILDKRIQLYVSANNHWINMEKVG